MKIFYSIMCLGLFVFSTGVSAQMDSSAISSIEKTADTIETGTFGSLHIATVPIGAVVFLDETNRGVTPVTIDSISKGVHSLRVTLQGYLSKEMKITLDKDSINFFDTLKPAAYLTVKAHPHNATIMVNGQPVGTDRIDSLEVPAGSVSIQVKAPGYDVHQSDLDLVRGELHECNVKLISSSATLEINSDPAGAGVFLNGEHSGRTPFADSSLEPGAYRIQLKLENHVSVFETVALSNGQKVKREYVIEPLPQINTSVTEVKNRNKLLRWTRCIAFGVLAAGSGGLGAYFDWKAARIGKEQQEIQDDYRDARKNFEKFQTKYDEKAEEADWALSRRNIFYGCAGAFTVGLLISIPF